MEKRFDTCPFCGKEIVQGEMLTRGSRASGSLYWKSDINEERKLCPGFLRNTKLGYVSKKYLLLTQKSFFEEDTAKVVGWYYEACGVVVAAFPLGNYYDTKHDQL